MPEIIRTPSTLPNWENRTLFKSDNLQILRAMNSNSVDLIATDPPFNKGKDFHATPESLASGSSFQDRWSWRDDVDQEWVDQITDDFPEVMNVITGSRNSYGDDMGAYLAFMAVRLLAMRRVLKDTGSVYLHCDPTASHYLKELMDSIFGRKNFVNEIIWAYKSGGAGKSSFARKHDVIFLYAKSKDYQFFPQKEKSYNRGFKPYRFKGVKEFQDELGWYTLVNMRDVWNIDMVGRTSKERFGYPTQKPLALYERMIVASSKEGDVVLDPFCGCATTLVAAERLKRQWVGIDIWEGANDAILQRLQQEALQEREEEAVDALFDFGKFTITSDLPIRTDDGETAVPYLKVKEKVREPDFGRKMSRSEMYEILLSQTGAVCQGCDRSFDDQRYLELDHNTPRSDGGLNHISNRVLLCSPCNRAKSNQLTLSGLRRLNKTNGWMSSE